MVVRVSVHEIAIFILVIRQTFTYHVILRDIFHLHMVLRPRGYRHYGTGLEIQVRRIGRSVFATDPGNYRPCWIENLYTGECPLDWTHHSGNQKRLLLIAGGCTQHHADTVGRRWVVAGRIVDHSEPGGSLTLMMMEDADPLSCDCAFSSLCPTFLRSSKLGDGFNRSSESGIFNRYPFSKAGARPRLPAKVQCLVWKSGKWSPQQRT